MKAPFLIFASLLLLPLAEAKPHTARATYSQMKSDVQDFSQVLNGIDGCDFQLTDSASGGMVLTMNDAAKGPVSLTVSPDSEITLDSGDEEMEDGSFSKSYKVSGAGELDVVHADDAYDHAFLTDANGHTVSCEIDF